MTTAIHSWRHAATIDTVEAPIGRAREAAVAAGRLCTALLEVDDAAIAGFSTDEIALHWSASARTQLATARYLPVVC